MLDLADQLSQATIRLEALLREYQAIGAAVSIEEERVSLLRRLIEIDDVRVAKSAEPAVVANTTSLDHGPEQLKRPVRRTARPTLEEAAVAILMENDRALHISEIREHLLKRAVKIPGKGLDANIIARLIRHPGIERESGRRGYYRLART